MASLLLGIKRRMLQLKGFCALGLVMGTREGTSSHVGVTRTARSPLKGSECCVGAGEIGEIKGDLVKNHLLKPILE